MAEDPVVARALRELPVPDHRPGFWSDLDERLRAEEPAPPADQRVSTSELPAVSVLRPEPAAASPARRLRFLAAAAVLALAVLTAGLVLRGDDTDGGRDLAATTTTTATSPAPAEATAATAVLDWVQALGAGDLDAAAALLGPASVRHLEATGSDPMVYVGVAAEGYGAWGAVGDLTATVIEIPEAGAVVVLAGNYEAEGTPDPYRVDAIPVVEVEPGRWLVDPVARPVTGTALKLVTPERHPEGWLQGQAADTVLAASSDVVGVRFWFSLDGAPAVASDDGTFDPPGDLASGYHRLVVVAVGDGVFVAEAGDFLVEG